MDDPAKLDEVLALPSLNLVELHVGFVRNLLRLQPPQSD